VTDDVTVGVVGGYGATGRVVVSELWKSSSWEIRIGGRDLAKAKAFAADFDQRVTAAQVDVLDSNSLENFCSQCSIVVNCAGPVMLLQDRVAQAAFHQHCHYVDAAGLTFVKEHLLQHSREIADLGLSFVVSAGWIPGISELLPRYAHAQASARMETIKSLTVYFGDSGEWSDNAFRDTAWFLRRAGLHGPRYFCKGEGVRAKLSQSSLKLDLGGRIGLCRFTMFSIPELDEVGHRLKHCDVFTYSYLPSLQVALTASLIALLPLPEGFSVRLLRRGFRTVPLPVGGFIVVSVKGQSQGQNCNLTAQIIYDKQRDYWINGVALATVARMVSNHNGVQPGVHFLTDAVDPMALMAELRKAGVEQTENLETCD
jgi:saccharopine dehydrogenase (NAD+, L-lysine-forming)